MQVAIRQLEKRLEHRMTKKMESPLVEFIGAL